MPLDLSFDLPDCDVCKNRRHIKKDGVYVRCVCIQKYIRQRKLRALGDFEGVKVLKSNTLLEHLSTDILLVADREKYRGILAGVVHFSPDDFTINVVHAYDLMESYLEGNHLWRFSTPDLLIILLGFSPLTNRKMEEVLLHVWASREKIGKSTWFVAPDLKVDIEELYGEGFYERLSQISVIDFTEKKG